MPTPTAALATLEALAAHLAAAFESGDPAQISAALHAAAHAPASAELAAAAGYPVAALRAALERGELPLDLTLGIMKVIDLYR